MKLPRNGFTVVELLIVVMVVAILASITTVAYIGVQKNARDAKVRDGAAKIAEAIELLAVQHQITPATAHSNWGSDGPIKMENGKFVCTDDASPYSAGSGWFAKGTYACTIEEILVQYQLLPADFRANMPNNAKYNTNRYTFMTYGCSASKSPGDFALLYSLEAPTDKDRQRYDSIIDKCGQGAYQRDNYNMQGAILLRTND